MRGGSAQQRLQVAQGSASQRRQQQRQPVPPSTHLRLQLSLECRHVSPLDDAAGAAQLAQQDVQVEVVPAGMQRDSSILMMCHLPTAMLPLQPCAGSVIGHGICLTFPGGKPTRMGLTAPPAASPRCPARTAPLRPGSGRAPPPLPHPPPHLAQQPRWPRCPPAAAQRSRQQAQHGNV